VNIDNKRKIIIFALLIASAFAFAVFLWDKVNLEELKAYINSLGIWGPLVFSCLYVAVALTGISVAFLTTLSGTIFGLVNGLIIVVLAATLSATIAFYLARFIFRAPASFEDNTVSLQKKNYISGLIEKIEEKSHENGFMIIAILRLSFLPYIPLSYAAGLVKSLSARDFILATFLTNLFGSFVFIFLGASLGENCLLFVLAIILMIAFMQIPKLIKKWSERKR